MWKTASILVTCVLILVTVGIIMLASASGVQGELRHGDPLFFVKRQLIWLSLGLIGAFIASKIPYTFWKKAAIPLAVVSTALLGFVLVAGDSINGSKRWIDMFGVFSLQPSEPAKITTIFMLAWWMAYVQMNPQKFWKGLVVPMVILGVTLGLVFVEPDYGTTMLIAVVGMTMLFVGGTRFSYLLICASTGLVMFTLAVMQNPERMRRIVAFMNPTKYAEDEAFQLLNAIYAFVSGGPIGVGLGEGLQKHFYLPEAHTDFILAIIGEEFGLATLGILIIYAVIFICGIRISMRTPDTFGRLTGFGICLMMALQAIINIGVVTGSMPTKGLALPFISFGGSSMIMSCVMIGILVNIASQCADVPEPEPPKVRSSSRRVRAS